MKPFIHLHTHSNYTLGNSTLSIEQLVNAVKADGATATALVDSGTIAGYPEFTRACSDAGIQPIYGYGAYLAKGSHTAPQGRTHLVMLAFNPQGLENIKTLDHIAQSSGLHGGKAHIDDALLAEHKEGLIVLTGGLGGEIDKLIVADELDAATERARFFQTLFGANFYLELQDHGSTKNQKAIAGLLAISKATGIPTLVSQGAFYLKCSDANGCNTLREGNGNKLLKGEQYHLRTSAEMYETFAAYPDALENSARVAQQCLAFK